MGRQPRAAANRANIQRRYGDLEQQFIAMFFYRGQAVGAFPHIGNVLTGRQAQGGDAVGDVHVETNAPRQMADLQIIAVIAQHHLRRGMQQVRDRLPLQQQARSNAAATALGEVMEGSLFISLNGGRKMEGQATVMIRDHGTDGMADMGDHVDAHGVGWIIDEVDDQTAA